MKSVAFVGRSLALSLCLLILPLGLRAQVVRVEVPQTVVQGASFQLSYTYSGSEDFERVTEPKVAGLQVLYGPARQQMSSFQSVNGRNSSTSSVSLTYTLMAERTGSITIPAATATIGGKRVNVHGATVRVLPPDKNAPAGRSQSGGATTTGSYFFRALPGATVVYEKQAFPIRYKLYATTEFDINTFEAPQYDGFLSEKQADDGRRQLQLETYQGRNYRTVDILSEVLFPQRSGTLTIPSSKIGIRVPVPQASDDPFFGSAVLADRTVESAPVTIQVRPLPTEGQPKDFSGAVGSFRMRAELLTKTPKTNESVTIRLTLEGTGNLKQVISPAIAFPQDFEVYGKKIIEYFAIPRRTGSVTIPALTFSYFDPKLGRYETLRSQTFSLNVAQGPETASDDRGSLRQQEQLLRQLHDTEGVSAPKGLRWAMSWSYLLLFPLIALLGFIAYLVIAHQRGLRADSLGYKASRASSVATKRLRTAHKLLKAGKRDAFYEEALRALWGYLGDKLRLPVSELSRSSVSEILRTRGLGEETIRRLTQVIDEVEFARYAPAKEGDMQALYDTAAEVIGAIDSHKL